MATPRTVLGSTGAAALAASLVAWAGGTLAAPDTTTSALAADVHMAAFAAERTVLLESAEAPGKAAVITGDTWPVESRTIAGDVPGLMSQAITVTPIVESPDHYVLSNAQGDVLARAEGSRSLELLDENPEQAAAISRATWEIAVSGNVVKVVNGEPLNGVDQALDLYDWSHAENARIATYDDNNFGSNQTWTLHEMVPAVDSVTARVAPGTVPEFPSSLEATYSWGRTTTLSAIEWAEPAASVWESEGTVEVTGSAMGDFGESVAVAATFTVGTVTDNARMVLLESSAAPGKAAVIAGDTWPVESRAIADDAAEVLSQSITMTELSGTADAYVLSNAEGDVLARVDGERSLELLDMPVADASLMARATWTLGTDGDHVKVVNRAPLNGTAQALDLYDWSTAENARIATYDDNDFGSNQAWTAHDLVASPQSVSAIVVPGEAPTLPASLDATYGWGRTTMLTGIDWDEPAADVWNTDGVVTVAGRAIGDFGETVLVTAEYTVGTVLDPAPVTLSSYAGVLLESLRPLAPSTVERPVSGSDATVTADVTWDWSTVTQADLDEAGTVTIPAVGGLGFSATLEVTLGEGNRVNVLRDTAVRGWSQSDSDPEPGLNNGNTTAEGWGNWRSGGAANRISPDWVAFYFDSPQQIDAASVYEASGADNIRSVTVQYRTMGGGWVDTSAGSFENEGGPVELDMDFDPVLATGVRVVIEQKSTASWMQLAEIEAWGTTAS